MSGQENGPSLSTLERAPWPATAAAGPAEAEVDLLERLRRGDEQAYETLVRDHCGRLLAVARRFLAREEDARDAVQETFLAAYRSIERFRGGCRLSTWLHRITVNACLMRLRSQARCQEQSIEPLLPTFDETGHHASPVREWAPDAEERLRSRETRSRVRRSIQELPLSYREVLLLRDIEELSTEETAQALGITANAVKIRLHRARQALRTKLDPLFAVNEA